MSLVKLTIDDGVDRDMSDSGIYFIPHRTANELLSSDLEKPIELNGLIRYVIQDSANTDADYRRLTIDTNTEFTLSRAKSTDVPTIRDNQ
jgi:hypothetical protein